jgi:hypothetical protein
VEPIPTYKSNGNTTEMAMDGVLFIPRGTGSVPGAPLVSVFCDGVAPNGGVVRRTLDLQTEVCHENGTCALPLVGQGDASSPTVSSFDMGRTRVNTTLADAAVGLVAAVADDWSGALSCEGIFSFQPSVPGDLGNGESAALQLRFTLSAGSTAARNPFTRNHPGVPTTAEMMGELVVPAFWPAGNFTLSSLHCFDRVGRMGVVSEVVRRGVPILHQEGEGDTTSPSMLQAVAPPVTVEVNTTLAAADVAVEILAVDQGTGALERFRWCAGGSCQPPLLA